MVCTNHDIHQWQSKDVQNPFTIGSSFDFFLLKNFDFNKKNDWNKQTRYWFKCNGKDKNHHHSIIKMKINFNVGFFHLFYYFWNENKMWTIFFYMKTVIHSFMFYVFFPLFHFLFFQTPLNIYALIYNRIGEKKNKNRVCQHDKCVYNVYYCVLNI